MRKILKMRVNVSVSSCLDAEARRYHSPAGAGSPVGWGLCLAPAADWLRGDSSDAGEGGEPAGLPGEPGLLISATLVVAVMGRWGVATGAACS